MSGGGERGGALVGGRHQQCPATRASTCTARLFEWPTGRRKRLARALAIGALAVTRAHAFEVGIGGHAGPSVRRMALAAAEALQDPRCLGAVERLGGPSVTRDLAVARLNTLRFEDGTSSLVCRKGGTFAYTKVRGSTVWICPQSFRGLEERNRPLAKATIIHELFHTLGVREAPYPDAPPSWQITDVILGACR